MSAYIHFEYAIYLLPNSPKDPLSMARQLLVKNYPSVQLVNTLPDAPTAQFVSIRIQEDVPHEYALPGMDTIHHSNHGLTDTQIQALENSRQAIILDFAHPKEKVWLGLHTADALLEDLARQTGGLLWDEESREVFSPDAWHERRLATWPDPNTIPHLQAETVIHLYPYDDMLRAISLGMVKFGLPDIVVEHVSHNSQNQAGDLIDLFAQLSRKAHHSVPLPLSSNCNFRPSKTPSYANAFRLR
ncbi:MAG: hypothetical protein WBQ59_26440 [Candidatus Acidiferrum sp.]